MASSLGAQGGESRLNTKRFYENSRAASHV
jgi:hypothetical protein